MFSFHRGTTAAALLVLASCVCAQQAGTPLPVPSPAPSSRPAAQATAQPEIEMFAGESRVLQHVPAARVAVGNGKLLTASVLDNNEVLLFANSPGQSTMQVWTRGGRMLQFKVTVRPSDMGRMRDELQTLFSGLTTLSIQTVGDKIVIDGHSLSEEQLSKIDEISKRYPQVVNLTQFQKDRAWEKMIVMDVKVVEFKNRDKVREIGIRWDDNVNGPSFGIAGDVHASRMQGDGRFLVNPPQGANIIGVENLPRPLAPFRTYLGLISVLNSRIHLMEQDGDAVVLAQPQLTSRSGKEAEFHVGGQIPYAAVTQMGQTAIAFQNYGIQVKIKPWVDRMGQIQSDIMAEVSEPDADVNPHSGVPGLRTRKAKTSFNVRAGETMVIAGLLQRRKGEAVARVPGLGSLPVVGEFFKSTRTVDSDSELVVFVTPTVLDPQDATQTGRHADALLRAERYLEPDAPQQPSKPTAVPQESLPAPAP
ncbi:MAG: pilus assembly protein N-terminal domain-containing protein [Pseudomonadota bacterium]